MCHDAPDSRGWDGRQEETGAGEKGRRDEGTEKGGEETRREEIQFPYLFYKLTTDYVGILPALSL